MRAYDPALTLRLFTDRDANITHFIGAPAHFQFMAQLPQFTDATLQSEPAGLCRSGTGAAAVCCISGAIAGLI